MIFYEAIHQNIGNTVLIQEWKKTKNEQKKILERARELGDFAELKSLFQVNDYFEEDGKSYIVLEYPVGQTLREYVQKNGNIGEKELIRNIHPFLKELSGIENAGIEDMAISMDNIYRKKDGSLCVLPDFGKIVPHGMSLSYQICEIMYECLTAQQPPAWKVRILFDDLEAPEKYDSKIDPAISQIITNGLCLETEIGMTVGNLERQLFQWLEQQKETEKSGKVKKAAIGICGIFLILGLLAGIWDRYREQLIFLGAETETVLLIPDENMTQADFTKAVTVIKKRVKGLTSKYLVKTRDGKISVKIPREVYDDVSEDEEVMKQYLSAPLKIYVIQTMDYSFFSMLREAQYVVLEPEDIESVENIELEKESQSISQKGMAIEQMLLLNLTDKASEKLKEKFSDRKSIFGCLDAVQNTYSERIETAGITEDWKKVGIMKNEYFQIAEPLLKEETFDSSFQVSAEIKVEWLDPEETVDKAYRNWIGNGNIPEPCVTMEYTNLPEGWKENTGDYLRTLTGLAERLETLEAPYAIGLSERNSDDIVIRLQQKHMTKITGKILGEQNRWSLETYWGENLITESEIKAEYGSVAGKSFVKVIFTERKPEKVQEFLNHAKEADGYVYLMFGDYWIAKAKFTELTSETEDARYEWIFEETDFGEEHTITEGMRPFIQLLQKINNHEDLQVPLYLKQVQYSDEGEAVSVMKEKNSAWEKNTEELDRLRKTAEVIDSYAEIEEEDYGFYYGTEQLCITLHMDTKEDYSERAYQRITELWEKGAMQENHYFCVKFFVGEKEQYPEVIATKTGTEKAWNFEVYDDAGDEYGENFAKLWNHN